MSFRKIKKIFRSKPTIEGAGVHLKRGFGYYEIPLFDPFLLFDDFHSADPDDYIAGFPWHPHRGIETVTYMLSGEVEHGDSLGNSGIIKAGELQWMTAGSGIIHQEMPKTTKEPLWGFQLWVNLPAKSKMIKPTYRGIKDTDILAISLDNGVKVKVICGEFEGIIGPVKDLSVDCEYLDIMIPPKQIYAHNVKKEFNAFAYIIEGEGYLDNEKDELIGNEHIVLYESGEDIFIESGNVPLHILLISGRPLKEPIAWGGPIVMNTDEELSIAFQEYQNGTFIK